LKTAKTADELATGIDGLIATAKRRSEALSQQELRTSLSAYAGEVKTSPEYALWLMREYGATKLLHLKENKRPIGREEAAALLQLKVKRGGWERLRTVQATVTSLLGVNIDAFESEEAAARPGHNAEMDVDEFLAEANGAGIREALRLILDLELQSPSLALIEEPEVHLHPGLERTMEVYLREKSREVQIFVTTHSTNFIDSVSFQNVYLVSRSKDRRTTAEAVDSGKGSLTIPAELGLRLSTVFMFDRLVFVEGPSDEEVLRELARQVSIDLARSNVGFVQMGGVRNFAHFAAEGTLDLLARRNVRMWFVTDRDERDDAEVGAMAERLGLRATLKVFARRELENYLLDPEGVSRLLNEKAGKPVSTPEQVKAAIDEVAIALQPEVVRLRAVKRLLAPVYPQAKTFSGDVPARLADAKSELERRQQSIPAEMERIAKEVEDHYAQNAKDLAPGALVLDGVAERFGQRFKKENGDSLRLARLLPEHAMPGELLTLLQEVVEAS
jgi:hypothetical protein